MKTMKLTCALVAFTMVFSLVGNGVVSAATTVPLGEVSLNTSEKKTYSTATLEDNFDEHCVLVVMSNAASLANLAYTIEDFSEINCKSIDNMNQTNTNMVSAKLSGQNIAEQRGASSDYVTFSDFYDVNTAEFHQILSLELANPGKENVLTAIKKLEQRADVLYAGPNYIYTIESEPAQATQLYTAEPWDPLYSEQWAMEMIDLPDAWDIAVGFNRKVMVGIVDTGVDGSHPDLQGKVNLTKSREFDTRGNIYSTTNIDLEGHGTMIAGIIGAKSFNTVGITGINYDVEIVSLRITHDGENTSTLAMIRAIDVAQALGIPILNISFGLSGDADTMDLIDKALAYSGLIVCSAGNKGKNLDEDVAMYPRNIESSNIIVVGASTRYDSPYSGSNYHPTKVDLFAPGRTILSCYPTSLCGGDNCTSSLHHSYGYHYDSGTSYAAPYVAGVASLLLSMYGDQHMTPESLIYHLKMGVDTRSVYQGKCETGGRLNAYNTLNSHIFTSWYEQHDSTYHRACCACAGYRYETHTWMNTGGMEICSECGYMAQ